MRTPYDIPKEHTLGGFCMERASVFPQYTAADRIMAVFYFLVGYGFLYVFTGATHSWALSVFTVFYAAVVLAYLRVRKLTPPAESWFWLAAMLAIGIPFGFWCIFPVYQILALMAVAAYWSLSATGRLLQQGKTSEWFAFDCWNALFWVPFTNCICQIRVLLGNEQQEQADNEKNGTVGKSGLAILLGLGLAVPVLLIVLPLLSQADAGFELLVGDLVRYMQEHLLSVFLRLLFSVPVSLYLYGLIFGGITGRNTDMVKVEQLQETRKAARRVPDMAITTVLVILCLVYLLFIGLQGNYLFAAFQGSLPEEFTYAEYARRGFFELCQIGAWNLILLGLCHLFSRNGSQENKLLQILTIVLSVQTLLLLFTAVSKLAMYIDVYGLTVNRVLPMTFLIWLVLVFVLLILRQKKAFPMARICILAGTVLFCLLCVFPVERLIEAYNVWARMQGYII